MFKSILVPTDGSPRSLRAVKMAATLANSTGANLTLLHVSPTYKTPYYPDGVFIDWPNERDYKADCTKSAEKLFATSVKAAQEGGVVAKTMQTFSDSPWEEILASAKKAKSDLVVMASHGRRGVQAFILGSETQKVLSHSKVPVLVVR
jgi:nucleotide-binding universal stress UspA family protein